MRHLGAIVAITFMLPAPSIAQDLAARFDRQIQKIVTELGYTDGTQIRQVRVGGRPAYMAILKRTQWQWKGPGPQSTKLSREMYEQAMQLPEERRLEVMDRFNDHIVLWGFTEPNTLPRTKEILPIPEDPHRRRRDRFYLGKTEELVWFGYTPFQEFANPAMQVWFTGDNVVTELMRGMNIRDANNETSENCAYLLGRQGAVAFPQIDLLLRQAHVRRGSVIRALGELDDPAVTQWLIDHINSRDVIVAGATRASLLDHPRAQAAEFYVKWLEEGAGKRSVQYELGACIVVKPAAAQPALQKVLESPDGIFEYRQALELSRELAGKPISPALLAAEEQIRLFGASDEETPPDPQKVKEATETIFVSNDPQTAAAIGVRLGCYLGKVSPDLAEKAGLEILRKFPAESRSLLDRLAKSPSTEDWRKQKLQATTQALIGP